MRAVCSRPFLPFIPPKPFTSRRPDTSFLGAARRDWEGRVGALCQVYSHFQNQKSFTSRGRGWTSASCVCPTGAEVYETEEQKRCAGTRCPHAHTELKNVTRSPFLSNMVMGELSLSVENLGFIRHELGKTCTQ